MTLFDEASAVEAPKEGSPEYLIMVCHQHMAWLTVYAEGMAQADWRDMQDRLVSQIGKLVADFAALAALKPFMGGADKTASACAAFVGWALSEGSWAGCDLDGGSIQTKAQALGLLKVVPYDPVEHEDAGDEYGVEPGDDWFALTDEVKALLPASDKGGE